MEVANWFQGFCVAAVVVASTVWADSDSLNPVKLEMFVDDLPDVPKLHGFRVVNGVRRSTTLRIGMFEKKWKFHRDMPPTTVFAYGPSKNLATVPGPTIEALKGVATYVKWRNHLPNKHILPWDPTIPTAVPNWAGIPTVVHLHGNIGSPTSDGHPEAWFTRGYKRRGPTWANETYRYDNMQQPGNLWYHDHALGLTRVNSLAGLVGAYIIRDPPREANLGLPRGGVFDRVLLVFDRSFHKDGSVFMNSTGDNPSIHPHWRPEYFGDVIVVNGKAWPRLVVRRQKYRFRIINASNSRFYKLFFSNSLRIIQIGSDSAYLTKPVRANRTLLAPSEIADVIIDFSESASDTAILCNDAPYPFPSGDSVNTANSKVMKFIITNQSENDTSRVPVIFFPHVRADESDASRTQYITLSEYTSHTGKPTHLFINGKPFDEPATETPKTGSTEAWNVINLTDDNHPLHIHLGLFTVLEQTEMINIEEFKVCMMKLNDAIGCRVHDYTRGKTIAVLPYQTGWKNVYGIMPGFVTKILLRFAYVDTNGSYPFDPTAAPGYVYHCHMLDHEDNMMMRPLKLIH